MTLTEFLLTRIAEDEEQARATSVFSTADMADWEVRILAQHSRRAMAECEAKRRIAEEHAPNYWYPEVCTSCHDPDDSLSAGAPWPCLSLRILATVYADHPDYRDEWRP